MDSGNGSMNCADSVKPHRGVLRVENERSMGPGVQGICFVVGGVQCPSLGGLWHLIYPPEVTAEVLMDP